MLTLSVIIPNYNHSEYLPEALEAILEQSWRPKEIVVVDDASTDESCALVEEYQKKHKNLHLIRMKENSGGPIIPLQEGLKFVTGDYLALCASDDRVLPGFFEEAMTFVSKHPHLGACCGNLSIFKDKKPYQYINAEYLQVENPVFFTPDQLAETCRKTKFQIASQASIYRRNILLKHNGYDPNLEGYSDYYLNYQIGYSYQIAYVPRLWGTFRIREQSYGIDIKWRKRYHLCQNFTDKIKKESQDVQRRWAKSGILVYAGWIMKIHLIMHPSCWHFLPIVYYKWANWKVRYSFKRSLPQDLKNT